MLSSCYNRSIIVNFDSNSEIEVDSNSFKLTYRFLLVSIFIPLSSYLIIQCVSFPPISSYLDSSRLSSTKSD